MTLASRLQRLEATRVDDGHELNCLVVPAGLTDAEADAWIARELARRDGRPVIIVPAKAPSIDPINPGST